MAERDDTEGLEAAAAGALASEVEDNPTEETQVHRCPACHRPLDDIELMSESTLLDHLQTELLRDLLRGYRHGTITHQEKAILRGLLRDNKRVVAPPPEEEEEGMPEEVAEVVTRPTRTPLPTASDMDETSGG